MLHNFIFLQTKKWRKLSFYILIKTRIKKNYENKKH